MITPSSVGKPGLPAGGVTAQPAAPERAGRGNRPRKGFVVFGGGALVVAALAAALIAGALPRWRQEQKVDAAAADASAPPPRVSVTVAQQTAPDAERVLPCNS